ncbi:MAG: NAD-dependent epimerase/dehydratase family protein, partial [Vulcanimicrobiaceae bacterium]
MRILITGNLGYVGTVMSEYLQRGGHFVRGFDAGYFAECALEPVRPPDEQLAGDVRSFDASALGGIDAVVHLAGLSNDPLGELDSGLTHDINVGGTNRIARAAKAAGIRRFVFASSCSLYGLADGAVALDENCPQNALTAYARSKVDGEALLSQLADETFRPIFLRFSTAYGYSPRLRLDLVVNNLVGSALARGVVALESDGTPWRPLVHVQDMAQAVARALESDLDRCGGQAFNIGNEAENYQIITIATHVATHCGKLPITAKPKSEAGDQRSYNVAFGKVRGAIPSFKTAWTLEAGIDDLLANLRRVGRTDVFDDGNYFRIRRIRALMQNGGVDQRLYATAA